MVERTPWSPGDMVEHIEILSRLGAGGMGVVYAGFDHRLKRRVALKVLQDRGRLKDRTRRRFLQEAQILSKITHPGVCQIHDLLTIGDVEVLILEEVPGKTLRQCMSDGMSSSRILGIGLQILDVLTAVHREGIVHRDLKAENVMLLPDGTIKVLDFGLARAVEMDRLEPDEHTKIPTDAAPVQAGLTVAGALVGTPRTMSPEQARGEPAGPATDIYATGLLLQEILTGEPLFEEGLAHEILMRKITWGDIPPPENLPKDLRSFIERLTSRAPADRPSARDAGDRLRFLINAPRRRRRRTVVAATLLLLTLLTTGFAVQWRRALNEAENARLSLAETAEVSSFLRHLFELSDPFLPNSAANSRNEVPVTAEDLISKGTATIRNRFADQPLARARFMLLLGSIEANLGHLEQASDLLSEACEIRRRHLPATDRDLGIALRELGDVQFRLASYDAAATNLDSALDIARANPGFPLDTAEVLDSLGALAGETSEHRKALHLLQESHRIRSESGRSGDPATALTLQRLASCELNLQRYGRARTHFNEALRIAQTTFDAQHPAAASLHNEIGRVDQSTGDIAAAERQFRDALRISRSTLSADHPMLATVMTNLANTLNHQKRYDEAGPLYLEAVEVVEASLGSNHPKTAQTILNYATHKQHIGDFEASDALFARAIAVLESRMGAHHPTTGLALNNVAVLEQEQQRYETAEKLYSRALNIFTDQLAPSHPLCAIVSNNLGEVTRLQGRLGESAAHYERAIAIAEQVFPAESEELAEIKKGAAATEALLADGH